MRFYLSLLACLLGASVTCASVGYAQGTDIVRGIVRGPGDKPVAGANVTITVPGSEITKTTRTNNDGVYTALFTEPSAEYIVTVKSIGFTPRTMRVQRIGNEAVLIGNVQLQVAASVLDVVTIKAEAGRPRPPRADEDRSVGGNEIDITSKGQFLENPGDLAALAATIPGVRYIPGENGEPGSFSVLGVSPDQNKITVDGSVYSGSSLPQDAIGSARLVTSSFDPSKGQFAGAQLVASTRSGRNTREATARLKVGSPALTWSDPSMFRPEQNTQSWSGSIGGPIKKNKAFYFGALQFDRRANGLLSLLTASDGALSRYGIQRDSIAYLSALLTEDGVPLTASGIPLKSVSGRGSVLTKIDLTPSATTTLTLRGDFRWGRSDGSVSTLAFPASGMKTRNSNSGAQLILSKYFNNGFLNELKSYASFGSNSRSPYLAVPNGRVLVTSVPDDNGTSEEIGSGLMSLGFGGNASGRNRSSSMSWETTNETSWLTKDSKHQFKLSQSLQIMRERTLSADNTYGRFQFNSLADLAAETPTSFTRTLSVRERVNSSIIAGLSLGDSYQISRGLQMQYGLRLDAARPGSSPRYNPVVDSLFGVRTDIVPRDVAVSPRLGFSWTIGLPEEGEIPMPAPGTVGQGGFGAGRGRAGGGGFRRRGGGGASVGAPATISGGIGAFSGTIPSGMVMSAAEATGLPNSTTLLSCIGAAAPVPDWDLYLSNPELIPSQCLDGTAPVVFSSLNPNVTVLDPNFRAPVSWRANLDLSKTLFGWLGINTSATYSLNLNEPSAVDLNFNGTPAFHMTAEGGRPVFLPPSAIVPATGAVATPASRKSDQFNNVLRYHSDMKSVVTQLNISLNPQKMLFNKLPLNLSYTNSSGKALRRGFESNTSGDPFLPDWEAAQMSRHQFTLGTNFQAGWLTLGMYGDLTSGVPYTPIIAGDVNGDGNFSNDRAFIFDPETVTDPELAGQMRSLLDNASGRTLDCLKQQLGNIAGAGSCRSRWSMQPNLTIGLNPNKTFNVRNGLQFSVLTINAFGALSRLVGLENTFLGQSSYVLPPDPTLLYVTGFDPVTQSFKYRVNENFGDARRKSGRSRHQAPFQVLLQGELKLGGARRPSIVESMQLLAASKESPPTVATVSSKLTNIVRSPLEAVLSLRDSILLTSSQISQVENMHNKFRTESDSTMADLAKYVVDKGKKITDQEFIKRLQPKQAFLMQRSRYWLSEARKVLTPEQWGKLPEYIRGNDP